MPGTAAGAFSEQACLGGRYDLGRLPDQGAVRFAMHPIGLWGIPVVCGADEWLILWEAHEDMIVVHHIVPAP